MTDKYILEGHDAKPCDDLLAWGQWMQEADRKVCRDQVGEYDVSTVFLGLDHNYGGNGPPLIFETMVFGDDELDVERYATWNEAERGHDAMVRKYTTETQDN